MGIETITEKILAEANNDARKIFEKGKYEGRSTIYQAERKVKQHQSEMERQAKIDADTAKKRKNSVAQLEARKMRLGAKQEAISRCFAQALEELSRLPEEIYLELLVRTAETCSVQDGELLLTEGDRKRIGEKMVSQINQGGKLGTVTLSDQVIKAAGGFVLRKGAVEINSTLEVMVEAIREEITPKVVETLFGERK